MNFNELELKINDKVRTLKFKNKDIKVKQYLPIQDKLNLVQIALQQSLDEGVYNDGLLTAYFHTYVVMFYTDLEFTEEEKQDVLTLFNLMDSENLIGSVIELIPQSEFGDLLEMLNNQQKNNMIFKQSAAYVIGQFIDVLPSQMEKVGEIVNNFDPSKYQAVVDFATAANGGRNIVTNEPVEN
ncbi:MAG: hypothetical protein J6T10_18710 [Methanobrevibacter sp.]|nr:hypothetical protein [Methanobrevibacter sp.]